MVTTMKKNICLLLAIVSIAAFGFEARFSSLEKCGKNAFDSAFKNRKKLWYVDFSSLSTTGSNAFHNAFYGCSALEYARFGSVRDADLAFDQSSFSGCTNIHYAAFDSLEDGDVSLYSRAPLVVSASNVCSSAVIDVSQCTNLREIRFDTVSAIVNYDSRWIPQNADWKAYVPGDLYFEWIAASGWSSYATNIVTISVPFKWIGDTWMEPVGEPGAYVEYFVGSLFQFNGESSLLSFKLEDDAGSVVSEVYEYYESNGVKFSLPPMEAGKTVRIIAVVNGRRVPSQYVYLPY